MKGNKFIYLAAFTIALLLMSCENGYDCYLENVAYNRIGFYRSDSTEVKYEFPEALTVSLMINGENTIAVNHIQDTDNLMLPISHTSECDTVIFNYENNITDTLYVQHENIPYYQSMECGVIMYHKLKDIEHTGIYIDSVAIVQENVKFDANENVRIFFAL